MKKVLSIILAVVVLMTSVSLIVPFVSAEENTTEFAGGDGSAENPYLIANSYHLSNVNLYPKANYKMISDIDFSNQSGSNWKLICPSSLSPFKGTFDGNGYSIRNLYFSKNKTNDSALTSIFGFNYGKIYNLTVYNCRFISNISITEQIANNDDLYAYASGLVLYNYGTISNCVVDNPKTETKITSSYDRNRYEEKGWVSPRYAYSGGIAVFNESSGKIIGCQQSGSVRSETAARVHKYPGVFQEAESYAGGIVAINEGHISECFVTEETVVSATYTKYGKSEAYVTSYTAYDTYSGTIAAKNSDTITKCFSYGYVTDNGYYTENYPDCICTSHGMLVGYGYISNSFYYNNSYKYSDCYMSGWGYAPDCYYYCGTGIDEESGATYASQEDFANGKVAFYLNGGKPEFSESGIWHQNIDNVETPDLFPVLDSTHGDVYMTKACSEFGNTKPEQEINHAYIYQEAIAPTCTEHGKEEGFYCSICGFVGKKQYMISATGHSYAESREEPTCLEKGIITYTCHCGDTYTETIPATGHSFSESIISNATCTTDGKKKLICSCGFEKFETIDATGHSYTSETIAATCVKDGIITYTCHCGNSYTETIPATGHSYTSKTQNPTCTKDGLIIYTCSCGDTYTETIPATGHSYTLKTQKPTCTEEGYTQYTCSCGHSYTEPIPTIAHSYRSYVQKPSCTKEGYTKYTCSCGHSYTETIPATGHSAVTDEAVAPTCKWTGLTEGSHCSTCGETIEAQQTIPATGHSAGEWERDYMDHFKKDCVICNEIIERGTMYLDFSESYLTIKNGESVPLSVTVYCDRETENHTYEFVDVTNEFINDIVLTSSNNDVVTVNADGTITAKGVGVAYISIKGTEFWIQPICEVKVIPRQFTVTWVIDGVEDVQTINENAPITKPANPQKDGYKFVGWTPDVPQTMPAHNLTFTAVFEKVYKYTCQYCNSKFDLYDEYNSHLNDEAEKRTSINILSPSTTTINYGDRIILHAETGTIPNGAKIVWEINNNNFSTTSSSDGITFTITPNSSGKTTITAKIISSDGRVLCYDEQEMTSNAGFFQKIIAFFKNLFGMNKTIPQTFKEMF